MNEKEILLEQIREDVQEKFPPERRNEILTGIYGRIISALAQRLIKFEGYSVVNTILKREIRELAKRDARLIAEVFGLKNTPEDLSKVLKIAATIIGYNLKVEDDETIVMGCPFAKIAKDMREPTLCNICAEYVNGVTEAILGEGFEMKSTHDITQEIPYCYFKLRKK